MIFSVEFLKRFHFLKTFLLKAFKKQNYGINSHFTMLLKKSAALSYQFLKGKYKAALYVFFSDVLKVFKTALFKTHTELVEVF